MEKEQERLSALIAEHGWSDRAQYISNMVHDALAIENYPKFEDWQKEYGNRPNVFANMKQSQLRLKRMVGDEYERFIYSHRDL